MINSSIIIAALPLAVIGIVTYVYILRDDKRWILASIPAHLLVFLEKSDQIDLPKIIYTGFFFPALLVWFVRKWLKRERILHERDEFVFIIFLLFALLSVFVAGYDNPDSYFRGFREFYIFIPYLFYFPVRDYVTDEKKAGQVLWALLITCTLAALYLVYIFKSATADATHIWDVVWKRKNLSEPLYMSAVIVLTGMIASKAYKSVITIPLLGMNLLALGLTFTRGYWVATMLGIFFLMVFLRRGARWRVVGFWIGVSVFAVAALAIIFPRIFGLLTEVLSMRITSINLGSESFQDRLIESAVVLKGIQASPIIGNGFGSTFSFYEILVGFTQTTWYIHNGYLFLLYKLGIVGAFMYMFFYLSRLFYTAKLAKRLEDDRWSSLILSFVAVTGVMLIVNVTSPQFDDKVPILIMTVLWGISSGLGKYVSQPDAR